MLPLSKVIRTITTWDELIELNYNKNNQKKESFKNNLRAKFRNASVLTRYNGDKNYVIIDIDF